MSAESGSWSLRAFNGLAVSAMVLIVGGIGAELMAQERIFWALVLQVPLYALVALCWGVFNGARWVARLYLPAFAAGAAVTVGVYLLLHADTVGTQYAQWAASIRDGITIARGESSEAGGALVGAGMWLKTVTGQFDAYWLFGQPAVFWLVVLFAAGPAASFWKRRRDGATDKAIGEYLIHG